MLASGTGTVLGAILDAGLPVAVVVVDRLCRAVSLADDAGVPAVIVDRDAFGGFGSAFDRAAFTDAVVGALARFELDALAMAGFGTVLGPAVFAAYPGRVLNTHPALLPAFKGWHAVPAALAAGVKVTGCTVHVATEAVDDGPILAQEAVPVLPGDTEDTLHERIKAVEWRLYPESIRGFLAALGSSHVGSAGGGHLPSETPAAAASAAISVAGTAAEPAEVAEPVEVAEPAEVIEPAEVAELTEGACS